MKTNVVKNLIALFLAMPMALVYCTVFIILPDEPASANAAPWLIHGLFVFLSLGIGSSINGTALGTHSLRGFLLVAVPAMFLFTGASVLLGTRLHRDFYSAAFQYILAAPVFLLAYLTGGDHHEEKPSRSTLVALSRGGFILSVIYAQWIILMGYAIAVRLEPRPLQSMVYNLYNLALALLLLFLSRAAGTKAYRTLAIRQRRVYADGKDLALLIGDRKAALIAEFAQAPDLALRCPELQRVSENDTHCEICTGNETKATLCPQYRNTYNSILEIKKALEFLEIGTITAPDNKRKVLTEGWTLRLFRNARIRIHT